MLSQKNKSNSKGFGHLELFLLLIVIIGVSGVGYFVYKNVLTNSNNYTTLTNFVSNGVPITEKACISSQTGVAPNYSDTVTALISVNQQAGPHTTSGKAYNPLAFYSINGTAPITEDNWTTSTVSTIKFNLLPSIPSAIFSLGLESGTNNSIITSGSSQTIGSLNLCNTKPTSGSNNSVATTSAPTIKSTTSGPVTTTVTTTTNPSTNNTTTTVTTTNAATKQTTSTSSTAPTPSPTPTPTAHPTTPIPAPSITLSAAPKSLISGNASTLSWSTTNATSCTASGNWNGSKPTSGSSTTSALTITSDFTLSCSGAGGSTLATVVVTVTASTPSSCASSPPTSSNNSLYPLQQVVSFTGSKLPPQWDDYGNEVQQPAGYVAASHAVFVPGTGLKLEGYPDPISGSVGGVTAASGDVSFDVANSGGFDVCMTMSSGNWQNVHLVVISWPVDNNWNEGENDFFEGNPQSMQINVHEIGSNPAANVWQGSWPSALASGTHVISSRWDPINGYRFYLDGSLVGTAPVSSSVKTPTTGHQLSIQMQDTTESSTSTETTTVYWAAAYGYN